MRLNVLGVVVAVAVVGCGPQEAGVELVGDGRDGQSAALEVASVDQPSTVDAVSWNVEWYGDPLHGPTDEATQQANVRRVAAGLAPDLLGLVEVVSEDAFQAVVQAMPAHDGLLVTDPRVVGGAANYSADEQKVALIFHKRFTVESAQVVVTEASYAFAGRPPLEVHLRFTENGKPRTLVVLVAHFKAMANADGYRRRTAASAALKAYLDATYAGRWVLTMGDLNDDVDASTYRQSVSPFANFVADPGYRFVTKALSDANQSTTVGFSSTIDHHLVTRALAARYVEGSVQVLHPDLVVPSYGTSTSDHYPVLSRYDLR